MSPPRLWLWTEQLETRDALLAEQERGRFALLSANEMDDAIRAFYQSLPGRAPWPDPLPTNFPVLRLRMPDSDLAPDYFSWGTWHVVSKRLREVMALPDWAVSYRPAIVEQGSERAKRGDYALMYVRSFAEAIDVNTSDCDWEQGISAKTGEPFISLLDLRKIRFKPGLRVPCDLFADAMSGVELFATDALAQRVVETGLSGVQFTHPLWIREARGEGVIRAAEGMGRILWNAAGTEHEIVPVSAQEADEGPLGDVLRLVPAT